MTTVVSSGSSSILEKLLNVAVFVGLGTKLRSGQVELNDKLFAVPIIYLITFLLHAALPAFSVSGYCVDQTTKAPLQYRINGILVVIAVLQVYVIFAMHNTKGTIFYKEYFTCALTALVMGIFFSLVAYYKGGLEKYKRCMTIDQVKNNQEPALSPQDESMLQKFWLGRQWNPRFYDIDWKMYLYLQGAVMLELNVLVACRAHLLYKTRIYNSMAIYCLCITWFVVDYFCGEAVHTYTYDIFAEKVGFKLIWGCLFFYPFFYCIGIFPIVKSLAKNDLSVNQCVAIGCLYLVGWIITRGANMQKYFFRRDPESTSCFCGLIKQEVIPGTKLLCSGFWGKARHFNYLGEIIQAIALAIPGWYVAQTTTEQIIPWLYPLYYLVLFIPRERDDDKVCADKYGEDWNKYKEAVPYRIFPYFY